MKSRDRALSSALGLVLAFAGAAPVAQASEALSYGPAGTWVKPVAFTPGDHSPVFGRAAMMDIQVNLGDAEVTTYTETDIVISSDTNGILPSTSIRWNAATETPVVHTAEIRRGTETIDLLTSGGGFHIAPPRPANDATAQFQPSGADRVATLSASGLKAGDVVRIAYSIVSRDPALKGHYDTVVTSPVYGSPERLYVRAVWPKTRAIHWQGSLLFRDARVSAVADGNELLIDRTDVPMVAYVPRADNAWQTPRLVLTDLADWSDVAGLLAPAFDSAATLAPDAALRAQAERLRQSFPDPKVQAVAALRYLQSQMRPAPPGLAYTGGEALVAPPRSADALWATRAGDAKSLAVVLTATLRAMGLKADVALTSLGFGHSLDRAAPDIHAFERPLVRVEIAGKAYWIDPSVTGDRDLEHLGLPAGAGWALPLRAGAKLEDLSPPVPAQPTTDTRIRFDASAGLEAPVAAHIERTVRQTTGPTLGDRLEGMLPGDIDTELSRTFQMEYPWVQVQKTAYSYDTKTGETHLVIDGVARLNWQAASDAAAREFRIDGIAVFGLSPRAMGDQIPGAPSQAESTAMMADIPVSVDYPKWTRTEQTILLPNGGKGFGVKGDGAVDQTLIGVHYQRNVTLAAGALTVTSSSTALTPQVTRGAALADATALDALGGVPVYLTAPLDYAQTPADKALADADRPSTAQGLLARGLAYARAGENAAAVSDFDAALALRADWPAALNGRGYARSRMGDFDGAAQDFKAVTALDPQNISAYNGLGVVLAARKDYDGALAALDQAIRLQPDAPELHYERGRIHLLRKDYAAAAADAQVELRLSPSKALLATLLVIDADIGLGQIDDALALARDLVKKYPANDYVHAQLGTLLGCTAAVGPTCHPDRPAAFEELSRAIALHPTAYAYAARSQARPLADTAGRQADADAALALEPASDFARMTRAALYLYEKDYDKALADANAVLARSPDEAQALNIRAIVYGQTKRYDLQSADLEALVKRDPKNPGTLNALCWARATRNIELDKALAYCDDAIALSPAASYYDSRGLVNLRLGHLDAAQTDYDTALTKRSDLASSLYGRGLVKMRKGQVEDGKADIARATAIDPHVAADYDDMGLKAELKP